MSATTSTSDPRIHLESSTVTHDPLFQTKSKENNQRVKANPLEVINDTNEVELSSNLFSTPYGATVNEKHSNYVLMYDMLTGIRTAVILCFIHHGFRCLVARPSQRGRYHPRISRMPKSCHST